MPDAVVRSAEYKDLHVSEENASLAVGRLAFALAVCGIADGCDIREVSLNLALWPIAGSPFRALASLIRCHQPWVSFPG